MKTHFLAILGVTLIALFTNSTVVSAQPNDTILTNNKVELREMVSPQGFVHPGIGCNAETLSIMREKVRAGVSPWVDYFEGMRRTRYANLNQRPRFVDQIVNDGGISGFGSDAQLAWVQTIMYVVTGNEEYRKLPVEIIKWYGSRTEKSFFPTYFSDSHIKIGKHVNTFCGAVDILRAITPKDPQLTVTQEMIDALQKNCMHPIRKNCIERNTYFMNQHSYAIVGFLASTILGDEVEDYKRAVEWVTVNATSPNQGRNGAIKQQIRLVTRNDATGKPVKPNLQLVEMGRDMPHADGNINYLLTMSKAIDFQKTKVNPVSGTVTDKADGVSPLHFLDDRLPKGTALLAKVNLGYGLPWVPTYSETDPTHPDYGAVYNYISPRGRGGFGSPFHYYFLKGKGFDLKKGPLRYIKVGFDYAAPGRDGVRSGVYLDSLHNYAFDFWIGLSAAASNAAPDPEKAKRALAAVLPPLEVTYNGALVEGQQAEYQFVDLSAHAQSGDIYPGSPKDIPLKVMRDANGTGYVRMTLDKTPRTMVNLTRFPQGSGLRVRSNSFVKLSFYRDETLSPRGLAQELYLPNTQGQWRDVIANFEGSGLTYIHATPLAGSATVDFDRIETEIDKVTPLGFDLAAESKTIPTYAGSTFKKTFSAIAPGRQLVGGASWTTGKWNSALSLSGNKQYGKLPDNIVSNLSDFSVSFWVKPDKLDRWARIFDFGSGRENYMYLTASDGKTPKFVIRTPDSRNEQAISSKSPLQVGVWQHLAVTLSGNTAILYVDGEEVGRNSNFTLKPSSLGKTSQNYLGKSQMSDPLFAGLVDDFTIFSKALSAEEIKSISASNQRIDAKSPAVLYKFDQQSVEEDKEKVDYTTRNLPTGATFDSSTGAITWTPTTKQQGDHTLYVTARNGESISTLPVQIHVARDLSAALSYVARAYNPSQKYVATTEAAFKAALKTRDLPTLQRAVAGLQLLNPRLPDGTLDYRVASGPPPQSTYDTTRMTDEDPFTWGGIWGFDKNVTLDFGNNFKVKSQAFRSLARDGHPSRAAQAVVYGSNDRKHWTLLTEDKTKSTSDFQTLPVKKQEQNKAYRYLRLFKPAYTLPIFEVAEFRIIGERIEDYSPDYHVAYITGYNDGTFRPEQKLTKAEAVSLLAGLVDHYTDKGIYTSDFVDVPKNSPYYDDVAYMSNKGIGNGWDQPIKYVTGDAEKRFHPDALISRGELAGIMSRMQWLTGDNGPQLKDVTADTPNAAEIRRVVREGWLATDETGSFRPNDTLTRAEFVVAANKMLGRHYVAPNGTPMADAPKFKDVEKSYWAYGDIAEASTTHAVQVKERNP